MRAVSPVISTLLLVAIAVTIAGLVWIWSQDLARQQVDIQTSQSSLEVQCQYASLFIRSCDYNGTRILLEVQNSGTVSFDQNLELRVQDSNTARGVVSGAFSRDVNAGARADLNSQELSNTTAFAGFVEPLLSIRVTPLDCPARFTEVTSCS